MLLDAFDSNWIAPVGPHIDAFEQEMAARVGRSHAAALASGTSAIDLALRILGVERGDRVLASSLTFVGSVAPVVHLGAEPVFVDSEAASWNLDPDLVIEELERSAAAGNLPKAVIATDLYGQCADYGRLEPACQRYEIPLVEDAAEALGATHRERPAGSFGTCAVFSFNGNKIVTTSGGGLLASDDQDLVETARHLASQARSPAPHYEHEEVGFNYRMSNLCAAVGRGQLRSLDRKIARRRDIHERYRRALVPAGVRFMPQTQEGTGNYWLTVVTIDPSVLHVDRETVRRHLGELNIEARPTWKPMHMQPVFCKATILGGSVSEKVFADGLCLPSGSGLTDSEIDRVIDAMLEALAQ